MRHRIEAPSPLEDWRGAYDLDGDARWLAMGLRDEAQKKAPPGSLVFGEVSWRPPATGVFDRLQQNPPTTIPGVLRYRFTWEHEGTTSSVSQAIDFAGEAPNVEELRRLVDMATRAVSALSEKKA